MIGFHQPEQPRRSAVHSQTGQKIGYIVNENGQHFIENEHGQRLARIIRYKQTPPHLVSACGGSFIPRGPWFNY
jgi:hypothetical protein